MEKRIATLILVVIIGIILGVGIVAKKARQPMLDKIITQQSQILNKLNTDARSPQAAGAADTANLAKRVQSLEQKIAQLEGQWKGFQAGFQQAAGQGGAQPVAKGSPQQARPTPPPEDFSTVYTIDVAHSPIIGKENAPVTIVEFLDFQCPFCARFHAPIKDVLEAYPGKVNYMVKNFPLSFHPQARPAAKAAFAAAEQGKYREMVDALLDNGNQLSDQKFEEIAKDLGLNVKKFLKDYKEKDAEWEKRIQADMALGGKVGVRGTPTFYINGKKTRARDFNGFKREIDQILSE